MKGSLLEYPEEYWFILIQFMNEAKNCHRGFRWILSALVLVFLIATLFHIEINSTAQIGPGGGSPTNIALQSWSFYNPTNWPDDAGYSPVSFTNITYSSLGYGPTLVVDTNIPAWLKYNVVERDGTTNLTVDVGTVTFWFAPGSWSSTNAGGTGPGEYGRLIEVGSYTPDSSYGLWSIYVDSGGNNLYFAAQTNDSSSNLTTYLSAPISWTTNYFHFVALTYSATNTTLYLDGVAAAKGPGVSIYPGSDVLSNGFCIGSDTNGIWRAQGLFDWVATYNYPLDSNDVQSIFNWNYADIMIDPNNIVYMDAASMGSFSLSGTTNLAISPLTISGNTGSLFVVNSAADVLYEIQGCTNLAQGNWFEEGFIDGSELTNWTWANFFVSKQGSLFLRVRNWQDTTGTGIPDWWWLEYFGQITNVNAYASDPAGDGYTDLQKYQMGLNPTNYYNPNPVPGFFGCLDSTGTNVVLEWSSAPGPVLFYTIQRGILNTNGSYDYSQFTASSNATFFEDAGAVANANAQNNVYTLTAVYPANAFSGTNTWYVWWYSNSSSEGPPYGPEAPLNPYAYVDATGTNILFSWTPARSAMATNCLIEHGIYNTTNNNFNYSVIAQVNGNTNFFEAVGALTNINNWRDDYAVQLVYPDGVLSAQVSSYYADPNSQSIHVGANTNGLAAPANFYGYVDASGTNFYLNWSSATGPASNYLVWGGFLDSTLTTYVYNILGKVNAGTTSFEAVGETNDTVFAVTTEYTNRDLSQAAFWYPTNGAPGPGALYAYLDLTGTNVELGWSAATGSISGYLLQRSDNSYPFYVVSQPGPGATSFEDTNAVNTGFFDPNTTVYEIQAVYPNGGISPAVTAMVSNTPPVPENFSAALSSTGSNVVLTWTPALGAVLDYVIVQGTLNPANGTYSYAQIAEVGPNSSTYMVTGAGATRGSLWNTYQVYAQYAGGGQSASVSSKLSTFPSSNYAANLEVSAQLVRNQSGHWQLMFSSIPSNVKTVLVDWCLYYYDVDNGPETLLGTPFSTPFDEWVYQEAEVPVASLTNLVYVIPDWQATNVIPNTENGVVGYVRGMDAWGDIGNPAQTGFLTADAPCWVDGRQHMKQNLLFALRGATISQPYGSYIPLVEQGVWDYRTSPSDGFIDLNLPAATNYVESSFFHPSENFKTYNTFSVDYTKMDDLWPINANYQMFKNLYDTNYNGPTNFIWQTNLVTIPAPPVLGIGDPYWIAQNTNYSDLGIAQSGTPYNGTFTQKNGVHNLFGLEFETALVSSIQEAGFIVPVWWVLPPNEPVPIDTNGITILGLYSQTADPVLTGSGYYFAAVATPGTALVGDTTPVQSAPIPATPGFASTNQTGLMVASVGSPTVIGGWAKFAIQNGNPNTPAYLGQYFVTNAFVVTNGIMTTNTTGVVSPYGHFFPTQSGQVALVTMPDIDTGQQGTGVVDVISLCGDANHDGILDPTFAGPDFTSPSRPLRFWVDDSTDSGDFGGTGVPEQGSQGNGVLPINGQYVIHGRRDLVNLFPVYLNIGSLFQSNALSAGISATDTNWQFVLSQADSVLRFTTTDLTPTNYMNFLRDTNESGNLVNPAITTLTTISNSGVALSPSFIAGIATNNQGIILVQAAAATTQPLVLSIYHGTNQIAQTSLYLSISGVEQMFRYKNLLVGAGASESGLLPDRLTDADVPNEPDTTEKNVVFVHGYSVSPRQARGWFADVYKRLYWSGCHAKFYGVNWYGNDSQGAFSYVGLPDVTPNYQTNVVHAFQTAPLLANFVATLTNGPTVVLAHSLGNMVALSALSDYGAPMSQYFMLDAAVPMEAIDPGTPINTNMIFSTLTYGWQAYSNRLWASEWFNLWPTNDARSTLSWNGRFPNFNGADVYNFYSSGEEVLRTQVGPPPGNLFSLFGVQLVQWIEGQSGTFVWAWQEKCKGQMSVLLGNSILSSDHGGWGFFGISSIYTTYTVAMANAIPPSQLQTNAFFDMSVDTALFTTSSSGSAYAQTNRNRILADAIPAVTLPLGANSVSRLAPPNNPTQNNFDMQINYENGWPVGRGAAGYPVGTTAAGEWHHSDIRIVAYTFTYQLFNKMITAGNLK